jgi:SAM-dependent methyltransferase
MSDVRDGNDADAYWGRAGLGQAILDALVATGKNLDALTVDDLAPLDQYHGGGKPATERLARLAELTPGTRVLDVGGGLGGPARTLAAQFACQVTLVDPTDSYRQASELLTERMGLADRLTHRAGSALALPFEDGSFDVVWTQNSGMQIADKARLYAEFHRVLRPGGRLATQEPMLGPAQAPVYPLMWAQDASGSFLLTPDDLRAAIERAGFRALAWNDATPGPGRQTAGSSIPTIQRLVMGDGLDAILAAGERNARERRLVSFEGVFERVQAS